MTPFEQYPLVRKIMYALRDREPGLLSPLEDLTHKECLQTRLEMLEQLRGWLSKEEPLNITEKEVEKFLARLGNDNAELEALSAEYGFFRGFAVCAELLAEINAIREAAQ